MTETRTTPTLRFLKGAAQVVGLLVGALVTAIVVLRSACSTAPAAPVKSQPLMTRDDELDARQAARQRPKLRAAETLPLVMAEGSDPLKTFDFIGSIPLQLSYGTRIELLVDQELESAPPSERGTTWKRVRVTSSSAKGQVGYVRSHQIQAAPL